MKKRFALILAGILTISAFAVQAAASNYYPPVPHNTPLKHDYLMVIKATDTAETIKIPVEEQMTQKDMDDIVENLEDKSIIPEDCSVLPGRISFLECRKVTCDESPYSITFRVWGTGNRPVLIFFRAEDSEEWTLIDCHKGTDMEEEFPCNGYYAVGAAW